MGVAHASQFLFNLQRELSINTNIVGSFECSSQAHLPRDGCMNSCTGMPAGIIIIRIIIITVVIIINNSHSHTSAAAATPCTGMPAGIFLDSE